MKSFFYLWVVFLGGILPLQSILLARLSFYVSHYVSAFLNFFVGGIFLFLTILATKGESLEIEKIQKIPYGLYLSGIIGASFIFAAVKFVPKLGAIKWTVLIILGQLCTSLFMDHYGLFGLEKRPVNFMRVSGLILLFLGTLIVVKN